MAVDIAEGTAGKSDKASKKARKESKTPEELKRKEKKAGKKRRAQEAEGEAEKEDRKKEKKRRKLEEGLSVCDGGREETKTKRRKHEDVPEPAEKGDSATDAVAVSQTETNVKKRKHKKKVADDELQEMNDGSSMDNDENEPKSSKKSKTKSKSTEDDVEPPAEKKKKRKKSDKEVTIDEDKASKPKAKKRKRLKDSPSYPDPSEDKTLTEQACKALTYAWSQFHEAETWKFNKARQNWLIRNVWSEESIPDAYLPLVTKYLSKVQGGVRENLLKLCQEKLASDPAADTQQPTAEKPPLKSILKTSKTDESGQTAAVEHVNPLPTNNETRRVRAQAILQALMPQSSDAEETS
ncbi:hypothetical protein GLOTRDRAFT_119627 [Gloeophyllum trabeum ATCC 11539]|uniref:WKF domain-containing protein n=1 Tax=Gloeophyllum trabeum (strain ATCC 11539 / FP-39264 / Madison 617) TaxID=670483 RepID=S7QJR5_GLOTA|nr:uncharacterized protein GLOTRDRAFT_119627 [Gloeophyllum trabeum ATCC 11539]EPQ59582.1 hypothetical protein GLOTRDRAFT_119627 [Gloeophyllum trabeum ATCC 11539]